MYILYVGYPGFPKGLAQIQRQLLIAKGLAELKCNVYVLCRNGVHQKENAISLDSNGIFEGINYKYCSGTSLRPDNFAKRNLLKVKGFIIELLTIIRSKYSNQADAIIITSNSFFGILYYSLLARILNITSVVDQVEYWSALSNGTIQKIDSYFNDRFYFYFPNKVIVISDYLKEKIQRNQSSKQVIKIPVLCDFEKFAAIKSIDKLPIQPYYLYCGSAIYKEVILFIIDVHALLTIDTDLVIIASGDRSDIQEIVEYINLKKIMRITIKSNIPYHELINLYKNSYALLIPLRPTLQDIARFPHKIGEYTASQRPIISTNIGEVSNYFKDGLNAFLCASYNLTEYKNKIEQVFEDKQNATNIGNQSFKTGTDEFNYKKNAVRIYNFIFNEGVKS